MITMTDVAAFGGAKLGSLRLGFIPLGLWGHLKLLSCCSHVPEVLKCLAFMDLLDKERLFWVLNCKKTENRRFIYI